MKTDAITAAELVAELKYCSQVAVVEISPRELFALAEALERLFAREREHAFRAGWDARRDDVEVDKAIRARIDDAAVREREACAKVADTFAVNPTSDLEPGDIMAKAIARTIRARGRE